MQPIFEVEFKCAMLPCLKLQLGLSRRLFEQKLNVYVFEELYD